MERAASKETVQQPFVTLAFGAGCGVHVSNGISNATPQFGMFLIVSGCKQCDAMWINV